MTDTLERFGAEFQTKVLSALIQDQPFVEQTYDIVDPDYFESDTNQWIVQEILNYYIQYRKLPTPAVFRVEMDKITDESLRVTIKAQLKNIWSHRSDNDLKYVKDKFLQFCRNQSLKNAIVQSVDMLERHRYDDIKALIDNAMKAGMERNFGRDWKKDADKRLLQNARLCVPTPWKCINAITEGGLAPGELGCIIAPSGAGKSWMLSAIGAGAMKLGKHVLHITLELNEDYTGLRYDSLFTHIAPSDLKNHVEEVKRTIMPVPGKLNIKYFPSKTMNGHKLFAHMQQMINRGLTPDLLIIDYADKLNANGRSDSRYLELGAIYEELRSVAGELNLPCWTASQSQRSSITDEVIYADKIAESFQKVMTSDFVMSWARTSEDKVTNTARAHVIKNRFGPDGMVFPARMNVLEGVVEIYEESSMEGAKARQAMSQSESTIKKLLHQKLTDHRSSDDNGLG
jgi:replicative DNA helicase